MKKIPEEGIYNARELGVPAMLFLGLQQMVACFGATILVPLLTGLPTQTTLLMTGVCTLLFHFVFTRRKVPVYLGPSFAFLGGYALVKVCPAYAGLPLNEQLAYANGGIIVGALVCYPLLALAIKMIGAKRALKYLPPIVTGPIIMCIGLTLMPSAVSNASQNWTLALLAIVVVVVFSVYGKGFLKIIPILMGVLIPCAVVVVANMIGVWEIDYTNVANTSWVGLPPIILPKFDFEAIMIMAPICLATMMEHIGDICAISATTGQDFVRDPGLSCTLIGDGLMTALSAGSGASANTTYTECTSTQAFSKVYDPAVVRIAAVYVVILGFMPKSAAIIGAIPTAIVGGVSFVLYGMITAVGVKSIVENHVDLIKQRNLLIVSLILACGLGITDGITIPIGEATITLTGLAISAIVGIILNLILPEGDHEYGKGDAVDANNGLAVPTPLSGEDE